MNTLKSAAVVIVLAGVLYGVYVTLHQPPAPPPPGMTKEEVDAMGPPDIEVASSGGGHSASGPSFGGTEKSPADPTFAGDDLSRPDAGSASIPPQTLSATLSAAPETGLENPAGSEHIQAGEGSLPGVGHREGEVNLTAANFKRDWLNATYMVEEGKYREALATLTPYYRSPDLDVSSQAELLEWLDALAAKVIYSNEHHLAGPHVVQSEHERLVEIATRHGVTAQLLANINHEEINNPDILVATTRLKVVPGPFHAEVDLARSEITVFLGNLYAGRFPFALGNEPPEPGEYQVRQKRQDRTYYGDRVIAAGDPHNPYGQWWLDLGGSACIHGSPTAGSPEQTRGCISLSPQDAQDVAAILTVGSKVVVRR